MLLRRSHALLRLVDLHALSLLDYMSRLYKPILVTRLQHLLDQTLPLRLLLNDINVQGWHSIVDSCRGNIQVYLLLVITFNYLSISHRVSLGDGEAPMTSIERNIGE